MTFPTSPTTFCCSATLNGAVSVRQAVSVVKRRSGPHERSIRELRMTPNQIEIGGPLQDFEGILTGVPKFLGDANKNLLMPNDLSLRVLVLAQFGRDTELLQ